MKNVKMKSKKNMKEKLRDKRGITLISLVITVIILLILAAVAINLAIDSNGLFAKAGEAANKWNSSVASEGQMLENMMLYANEINGGNAGGDEEGDPPTEITTDLPAGWSDTTVSKVAKQGTRTAPIPTGFVASSVERENTISGGLVIYETTTPVTDENHDTALTDYNQYVWIPVDNINDMIMCSVCGGASRNLVYNKETKTLACTNTHAEGAEPKLVGKLYTGTSVNTTNEKPNIYSYTMNFAQNDQTYDPNSGFREPAVVTGSSGTLYDGASNNYHGLGSATAFLAQLQSDFDNMAKSVAKYKGFYISRYEIGANGASKKEQAVLNEGLDSANMWYGLYNTIRRTGSSTTSQMIWRKPV